MPFDPVPPGPCLPELPGYGAGRGHGVLVLVIVLIFITELLVLGYALSAALAATTAAGVVAADLARRIRNSNDDGRT